MGKLRALLTRLRYREIGDFNNGGYLAPRRPVAVLMAPIWRWRLRQALKLTAPPPHPLVIDALHRALREKTPMYVRTYQETLDGIGDAVDDLYEAMEWLRADKHYAQADRVRTIMGRLARLTPGLDKGVETKSDAIRDIARSFK